ncbi:MAG: 7-carboxy-7-deazaguanine synthase QueE [Phocaeicola vulgatus]|nr:MAG: 7-carboxy-7-deazaguanine synthase QueE [Phocaeicola vulgatus]
MRKINEIFYSLQGEGFHTGTPALFIRFSGCNLKCSFCDTKHEEGEWMSDEDIVAKAKECPTKMVVLTGGEPSLWIDEAFVEKLHQAGKYVCIETNGTHPIPDSVDWITCSPKGAPVVLTRIDEVKVVYTGDEDVEPYLSLPAQVHFLQPCSCKNTQEVVAYIQEHPQWRLSLQTHKWIGIL